jgi:hypothetical protein
LLSEVRTEEAQQLPQFAALSCCNRFEVSFLEMQAVCDHQLAPSFPHRRNHRTAFRDADRHGLFTQDMSTGLGSTEGEFAVLMVGQDDVNRVDVISQAFLVLVVVIDILDAIASRKNCRFSFVTGDQRRDLGILQVRKGRQDRNLGQMAQTTTA